MRNRTAGITRIVDLFYPKRCPVCDDAVSWEEGLICTGCYKKIQYITALRCRKCGKQLYEENMLLCYDCEQKQHIFDSGLALYDYQSMKKSIYRFKYHNRCEYAGFYAKDIVQRFGSTIAGWEAQALIPVPLHAAKLARRGYNQAELLTKQISKLTGIPMYSNLVRRTRKTVPQKELDDRGRQNNLKKAFNIPSNVVKLNKTIVVDDIYTTGSTIDAVASELKQRGVRNVYFITLCIGEGM